MSTCVEHSECLSSQPPSFVSPYPNGTDTYNKSVGFRTLHMAFQWWGIFVQLFFPLICFFGAARHVLMSVSSNMARPDESYVTSTTDQMGNLMFPSQYWRSRLTVWAPFAVINNARPQESTRLNSYSYEIAFLKHAAVLEPLGGISISPADARLPKTAYCR